MDGLFIEHRAARDRHGVSAIAGETQPAKLLAVFVVDTNKTELTIPFGGGRYGHG